MKKIISLSLFVMAMIAGNAAMAGMVCTTGPAPEYKQRCYFVAPQKKGVPTDDSLQNWCDKHKADGRCH